MSNTIQVNINQISASASQGTARDHKVVMDRPADKGGENRGAMGGEQFLMALGGCFMSNLLAAVQSREADVSDVKITITGTAEGPPPHFTAIEMNITAEHGDTDQLAKLVTIAERSCLVANTLKKALALTITPTA
jgi:putative redox protein